MQNFFMVIEILAASVFIFVTYYAGKNIYSRYQQSRIQSNIEKKKYEDEKKYIRQYIRKLLKDLEDGKLHWIQIFSRLNPENKLELIYNSISRMIQIQHRIKNIGDTEINKLRKLGLKSVDRNNELYSFNMAQNSTIVTDVVYFLLEHSDRVKHAQNIKVVTSGG